jgi:hypothetical protein
MSNERNSLLQGPTINIIQKEWGNSRASAAYQLLQTIPITTSKAIGLLPHLPLNFPVEEVWETVVRKVGGSLVSELLPPKSNVPNNADYLFRDFRVIAELKRIVNDQNEGQRLNDQISLMMRNWMNSGKIIFYGTPLIELRKLPTDCAHEVIPLFQRPIQRRLKQANSQIKSTKKLLNMENALGLLILVHDGNFLLRPENVQTLIARCLNGGTYSSINGIIYVNGNAVASRQGDDVDYMFFIHSNRDPSVPLPPELITSLQTAWGEELERVTGYQLRRPAGPANRDEAVAFIDSLYYEPQVVLRASVDPNSSREG